MDENALPVVKMCGIWKRFPGTVANSGVDFELRKGEIHTLLGENGAGKTTLMNILYGLEEPDSGDIYLNGQKVHFKSARDAILHGLGMVHQHFMLVQRFSVAENITLGMPSPRAPRMEERSAVYSRLKKLSDQYGLLINPDAEIWTLSVGEQQRVEILKALYRGAEVLILDEPTAVLTPQEADHLLEILRRLTQEGKSVVFISHKLGEVLAVSDRITVLRDGKLMNTVNACDTTKEELACMMVGREVLLRVDKKPAHPGEVRLNIQGLCSRNDKGLAALCNVDLEVRSGEILGIAGVAGNGQTELEEVIAGLRKATGGHVQICGTEVLGSYPDQIGQLGLAHIPSDRYKMAMLTDFTVAENLVLQRIGFEPFTRRGWIDWDIVRAEARRLINQFDVRTPSVNTLAGNLSGGNAQKMILARELARNPKVLIAAQPTRGLDVSAIEYVHRRLVEARDAGLAILLISTELYEIFSLSDRIAVMYGGRVMGVVNADETNTNDIGLMMAGVKEMECCPQPE
ncbi:MAG: ABC transporter ATP-binding protein [Anaerolineaceae bacterium]|nr:ABC transporter ATP-binding protein [Anaerolineaceae bacterium]